MPSFAPACVGETKAIPERGMGTSSLLARSGDTRMLDYVEIRDLKKPRMHSVYIATMASRAWTPQVMCLRVSMSSVLIHMEYV